MKSKGNVFINAEDLYQGKTAKIVYNGSLAKAGSDALYIHLGFGMMWDNLTEIKMTKTNEGYIAEVPIAKADSINFCFRDSNNNWDNNACKNYSYAVSKPKMIKATADTIITPVTNKVEAKMSEIAKIIENATPAVPNELSLVPSKNITEAYIQRKKNKLMFYRLFNFIPRELTGNGKKNKVNGGLFGGLFGSAKIK